MAKKEEDGSSGEGTKLDHGNPGNPYMGLSRLLAPIHTDYKMRVAAIKEQFRYLAPAHIRQEVEPVNEEFLLLGRRIVSNIAREAKRFAGPADSPPQENRDANDRDGLILSILLARREIARHSPLLLPGVKTIVYKSKGEDFHRFSNNYVEVVLPESSKDSAPTITLGTRLQNLIPHFSKAIGVPTDAEYLGSTLLTSAQKVDIRIESEDNFVERRADEAKSIQNHLGKLRRGKEEDIELQSLLITLGYQLWKIWCDRKINYRSTDASTKIFVGKVANRRGNIEFVVSTPPKKTVIFHIPDPFQKPIGDRTKRDRKMITKFLDTKKRTGTDYDFHRRFDSTSLFPKR